MPNPATTYPLITRDPVTGDVLLVTRLEGLTTGIIIEGRFHFGWMGRLTSAQLDFVRLLALHRGNIQKVASDLGIAYNTARTRSDEIATTLSTTGFPSPDGPVGVIAGSAQPDRLTILDRVHDGTLSVEDALLQLKAIGDSSPAG